MLSKVQLIEAHDQRYIWKCPICKGSNNYELIPKEKVMCIHCEKTYKVMGQLPSVNGVVCNC